MVNDMETQLYIAEQAELVICGLKDLLCSVALPVKVCGCGTKSEQVWNDLAARQPDILFIDERLLYQGQTPLYMEASSRWPQMATVVMANGPAEDAMAGGRAGCYLVSKATLTLDYLSGFLSAVLAVHSVGHGVPATAPDAMPDTPDAAGDAVLGGLSHHSCRWDFDRLLLYIREHLEEDLSLQTLARRFGYNYTYLSGSFSRYTGKSFCRYVNELRLKKACLLLEHGTTSISDVGRLAGYPNQSYFTQVFKRHMGCTPTSYQTRFCSGRGAVFTFPESLQTASGSSGILPAPSPHTCERCG